MVARSLLRRQLARPPWVRPCCVRTAVADAAVPSVVFLGTPECACCVLDALLDAEAAADAPFRLAAVVSQPGKPRGRGRGSAPPPPSPVAARALARGVPPERLLTPASARDAAFLEQMKASLIAVAVPTRSRLRRRWRPRSASPPPTATSCPPPSCRRPASAR